MSVAVSEDACAWELAYEAGEWWDVTVNAWLRVCAQALGSVAEDVQVAMKGCALRIACENACETETGE